MAVSFNHRFLTHLYSRKTFRLIPISFNSNAHSYLHSPSRQKSSTFLYTDLKSAKDTNTHIKHNVNLFPLTRRDYGNTFLQQSQLGLTQPHHASAATQPRCFHTSLSTHQDSKQTSSVTDNAENRLAQKPSKPPKFLEQMTLRLVNENGFLSWTRNSYLSAAVAASMLNGSNDDLTHNAGMLVLVVSLMNMGWGSACHVTNLLRNRDRIAMSRAVLFLNLLGTVTHALLWFLIVAYYTHRWGRKHRHQGNHNFHKTEIAPENKQQ